MELNLKQCLLNGFLCSVHVLSLFTGLLKRNKIIFFVLETEKYSKLWLVILPNLSYAVKLMGILIDWCCLSVREGALSIGSKTTVNCFWVSLLTDKDLITNPPFNSVFLLSYHQTLFWVLASHFGRQAIQVNPKVAGVRLTFLFPEMWFIILNCYNHS